MERSVLMRFERTTDYELLREIMTHPKIYPHIGDDFAPAPEDFEPVQHPLIWYVLAYDGDELLGLFMLIPQNGICWELHVSLLPCASGPRAIEALRGLVRWAWEHTDCRRLFGQPPAYNTLAIRLARAAGLTAFGRNTGSFMKHGKLHDQILLGVSRPEGEKCQD